MIVAAPLALPQLADEGLLNPKSLELMRPLERRRLVRVRPNPRLASDSFGAFVRGERWAQHGEAGLRAGNHGRGAAPAHGAQAFTSLLAFGQIRSVYAAGSQAVSRIANA